MRCLRSAGSIGAICEVASWSYAALFIASSEELERATGINRIKLCGGFVEFK